MYGIEEVGDEEIGKICLVLEELYELLSSLLKQNIKKIITDSYLLDIIILYKII